MLQNIINFSTLALQTDASTCKHCIIVIDVVLISFILVRFKSFRSNIDSSSNNFFFNFPQNTYKLMSE